MRNYGVSKPLIIFSALVLLNSSFVNAQRIGNNSRRTADNKFGKGIKILAQDSSFSMKFSTRIQSLYEGKLNLENDDYSDKFLIRRARLKFDGFAYSPKLTYKIELGLSNRDTGGVLPQTNNTARVILDAVLKWKFYKNWSLWVGQTKLPGNRERVISSQKLQFVDRSNVNSRFNIDRDTGIQLRYAGEKFNLAGAISIGEGRDITVSNAGGYDYTLRGEFLPFGKFSKKGDYFSSDLHRENTPKMAIGITYDINEGASRERGQLGSFLNEQRDLKTWFLDVHFKYRGFSSLVEYATKTSVDGNPVVLDDLGNFEDAFYTGEGFNWQAGYLFKNNFEVAGRYTKVSPETSTLRNYNTQYTLGLSKYIVGHSLKVQTDFTLIKEATKDDIFMYRCQVEMAF